jgi:hypothetical protein
MAQTTQQMLDYFKTCGDLAVVHTKTQAANFMDALESGTGTLTHENGLSALQGTTPGNVDGPKRLVIFLERQQPSGSDQMPKTEQRS